MSDALEQSSMKFDPDLRPYDGLAILFAVALGCFASGILLSQNILSNYANMAGLSLLILVLALSAVNVFTFWVRTREYSVLQKMLSADAAACFTTNALGIVEYQNVAAQRKYRTLGNGTLVELLKQHIASPSAVLFRLQMRAASNGSAREDVISKSDHFRVSVHCFGPNKFMWRIEEFADRTTGSRGAASLALPIMTANRAGVVLFANDAMRKLLGQRPRNLSQIFTADKLASGQEVQVSTAAGKRSAIYGEIETSPERREIYLLPVDPNQKPEVSLDLEHLPVILLTFTVEGVLTYANAAAKHFLTLDDLNGQRFQSIFSGLGRSVGDWLADIAAERLPSGQEVLTVKVGGEDKFVQVALRKIVNRKKSIILAVLQDATDLKSLEEQFVQSQKMQAIGQLAGGVAHDFNNLLTAISGHCELMMVQRNETDADYGDLIQIHQNTNRAASLVGQLLAFSRKQTLNPELLDVQDLLSDLTHLLNRLVGERVKLVLSHGFDITPIRADKRQLEQVIMNLVVNARDSMKEGGYIRVETEKLTLTEELKRDRAILPPGDYALIKVSDTGCGIPPDNLNKIFEPFFTTKKLGEGTGLGLSTAYGIIKQSGGFIFVDSSEGQGSCFQLYFPLHDLSDEIIPTQVSPPQRKANRLVDGVVLLVEDENAVRAFASRALRLKGYTVLEAANAEEALVTLADKNLHVDVFVTDVVMPGLDGPTWVREALKQRPDVKVIFVSGYAEETLSEDRASIPNSIFLAKPFSLSDLTMTVQDQMH